MVACHSTESDFREVMGWEEYSRNTELFGWDGHIGSGGDGTRSGSRFSYPCLFAPSASITQYSSLLVPLVILWLFFFFFFFGLFVFSIFIGFFLSPSRLYLLRCSSVCSHYFFSINSTCHLGSVLWERAREPHSVFSPLVLGRYGRPGGVISLFVCGSQTLPGELVKTDCWSSRCGSAG